MFHQTVDTMRGHVDEKVDMIGEDLHLDDLRASFAGDLLENLGGLTIFGVPHDKVGRIDDVLGLRRSSYAMRLYTNASTYGKRMFDTLISGERPVVAPKLPVNARGDRREGVLRSGKKITGEDCKPRPRPPRACAGGGSVGFRTDCRVPDPRGPVRS